MLIRKDLYRLHVAHSGTLPIPMSAGGDSAERKEARTWEEAGPQWFCQWVGLLLPEQNLFEFEPTITLAIPAGQPKIAQPSNFLWQRPQPIPTSISFARIAHG